MNNTFWLGVWPGINKEMMGYVRKTIERFMAEIQNSKVRSQKLK